MNLRTIFEDNIDEYEGLVDQDVAENMGRMYYRGIAGHSPTDNTTDAMLIWELKSVEDDEDTESEIIWLYAADPKYIKPLLEGYHRETDNEDVARSFLRARSLGKPRKQPSKNAALTFLPWRAGISGSR